MIYKLQTARPIPGEKRRLTSYILDPRQLHMVGMGYKHSYRLQ